MDNIEQQKAMKFRDQLISLRNEYKDKVEPEAGILQPGEDTDQKLMKDNNFHKVIISTTLLNMLADDKNGGFWPMISLLWEKAKGDIEELVSYYEVVFKMNLHGQMTPSIKIREDIAKSE